MAHATLVGHTEAVGEILAPNLRAPLVPLSLMILDGWQNAPLESRPVNI